MSDRISPRAQNLVEPYIRAAQKRLSYARPRPTLDRDLPDPPENPEFLELPEAAQELFNTRFLRGIHATEQADNIANAQARGIIGSLDAERIVSASTKPLQRKPSYARKS